MSGAIYHTFKNPYKNGALNFLDSMSEQIDLIPLPKGRSPVDLGSTCVLQFTDELGVVIPMRLP